MSCFNQMHLTEIMISNRSNKVAKFHYNIQKPCMAEQIKLGKPERLAFYVNINNKLGIRPMMFKDGILQ